MTEDEIYRIACQAAKSAAKRGAFMICNQDLHDMIQVAAFAIWQCRTGESEAYYFCAGRMAARNWLTWWKYGAPETKLRYGLMEQIDTPLSIDWLRGRDRVERTTETREQLNDEQVERLRCVFWITRRKHGKKELAGIERDISICQGLCREESTETIAHRLGLSVHMVNSYRSLLRKRMEKYIEANA